MANFWATSDSYPCFGGDSPTRMGDFSSWTGPFPSPIVPRFAQSNAFQGYKVIYVYFETSTLSWVHGDIFSVSATEHPFLLGSSFGSPC